jgi:hypothetical protein
MNQNYKLTLYAVQVYGVQERNTIRERAKNGNLYDEFNCYYISEEEACRSIDWALFILNIIYSNHEKH